MKTDTTIQMGFTLDEWDMIRYACSELSNRRQEQSIDYCKDKDRSAACRQEAEHLRAIAARISRMEDGP